MTVRLFPRVLTRIPCLPLETLSPSPFLDLLGASGESERRWQLLRAEGRALAEEIGHQIPAAPRVGRRDLLALRRDLHNGRWHASPAISALPAPLAARIADFMDSLRQVNSAEPTHAAWARATAKARRDILASLDRGLFACAVALANPELLAAPAEAVTASRSAQDARIERWDRALWSLRWRATLRTVPLVLYCSTGSGRWRRGGSPFEAGMRVLDLPADKGPGFRRRAYGATSIPVAGRPIAADSWTGPLDVDERPYLSFLDQVERYGCRVVEREVAPERRALALLIDVLALRKPVQLPELVSALTELAVRTGLPREAAAMPSLLARDIGQVETPSDLATQLVTAAALGLPALRPADVPAGFVRVDERRRAAFRFVPVRPSRLTERPGSEAFAAGHITFWGGDRMSFFPRYARDRPSAIEEYRRWLAEWPDSVDLVTESNAIGERRPQYTERRLGTSYTGRATGTLAPSDVSVLTTSEGDLRIVDADGRPIDPIYLGVLAPAELPIPFRLLLAVGPAQRSALHAAVETATALVAARMMRSGEVKRCPPVWLTEHVLLVPELWILRPDALPRPVTGERRIDRSGYLAFHRWAEAVGLPRGMACLRKLGGPPDGQIVDLDHPAGIDALRRLARHGTPLAVERLDLTSESSGARVLLVTKSGRFAVEHAVELGNQCCDSRAGPRTV